MNRLLTFLDFLDTRWWLGGAVVACLAFGITQCHARDVAIAERATLAVKLKQAEKNTAQWQLLWVQASERVAKDGVTVTKTVDRWRTARDTLLLYPVTRADTIRTLNQIPVFALRTDTTIRACTQFQLSCAAYRRVTDSLVASVRDENAIMKRAISQIHRRTLVERLVDIAVAGGVGYGLGRVVR